MFDFCSLQLSPQGVHQDIIKVYSVRSENCKQDG